MIDCAGQVAVVTGAGSGFGRATAELLAGRGARVLVNDRASDGRAEAVVSDIQARGGAAVANVVPVGASTAREIVAAALDAFDRVDVLVNNAGVARLGEFDALADETLAQVMDVNLLGPYALNASGAPTGL